MSAPLPEFWTEQVDGKGRTYYSNHKTQTTTWERPVVTAPPPEREDPPVYAGNPYTSNAGGAPPLGQGPCCTPRLTFWISCALGWVVWAFAVGTAADDNWIKGTGIAAGEESVLEACDSAGEFSYGDGLVSDPSSKFCDNFEAFSAMQFIAVVLASVAMVVLMVTPFRPKAGKCCSIKHLAIAGGSLMAGFSFFQMLAFVLVIVIEKDIDNDETNYTLGGTFAVAVIASVLGVVQAAAVLLFARSSGDGPFYSCCHQCMAMNNDPNAAVGGGGGGAWSGQQQQPQPPAPAPTAAPAAAPTAAPAAAPAAAAPSSTAVAPPEPASTAV